MQASSEEGLELTEAVKEMQKLLQKYKKNISDTIEKNIMQ